MSLPPSATDTSEKRALLAQLIRERARRSAECPLSSGQLRLWRTHDLEGQSPVYNIAIAYSLNGPLQVEQFVASIRDVASRHESFSTSIDSGTDGAFHRFESSIDAIIDRVDARSFPDITWPTELLRIETNAASIVFDLTHAPLWRFTLVERTKTHHILIITTHHIVADRWSIGLFAREISENYAARLSGESPPANSNRLPYPEAIRKLEADLTEESLAAARAHWAEVFANPVADLQLPTNHTLHTAPTYQGIRASFALDNVTSARIDTFARNAGVTPYIVFLAALATTLRADTDQSDLVVVTPVSGRHRAPTRGVLGYFNNLLPLRLTLANASSFRDIVTTAEHVAKLAFTHQDLPFSSIAELPGLAHTNLARCLFSLQNTTALQLDMPCIESSYHDVSNRTSNFDLALFIESYSNAYRGFFDAKSAYWSEPTLDGFVARYRRRLDWLLDHPDSALREMPAVDLTAIELAPEHHAFVEASTESAKSPRNELERRLIVIWEKVLGITPITPASNFFDLGGHSLSAARLVERMGKEIGRELPLAALLQAPTIREFSRLITNGDDAPCWVCLVPLQPSGNKPPFFCVHGGGGGVLTFTYFANVLGSDQPLYGLQSPRQEGPGDGETVEDLAEIYLKAIVEVQPTGPYYLAGHSFGGLIAYEMARQLTARGERIALLAVIDHPGPDVHLTWRDKWRWQVFTLSQLEFKQKLIYLFLHVTWLIRRNEQLPLFLRKIALAVVPCRGDWKAAEHRLKALSSSMKALELYRIAPYPGPLTLFRARQGGIAINCDPNGGWSKSAQGGVEVHDFPCGHMQLFEQPHLLTLATLIRDAILRAQTREQHSSQSHSESPP